MRTFSLKDHELGVAELHHTLSASSLDEHARKTSYRSPGCLQSVEQGQGPWQSQCASPDRQLQ